MILQALTHYYDRLNDEGIVAQQGFKRVEIPFLILLNRQGQFAGLQDTRAPAGKKLVARSFVVPEERGRSGSKAWQTTNLLWDHYGYVFGWPKSEDEKDREMARKQHETFVAEIKRLHETYHEDLEIEAIYQFLLADDFSPVYAHPVWKECAKIPGCNLTFMVEGETRLVCQNDNVKSFITNSSSQTSSTDDDDEEGANLEIEGVCLVTGELGPIARLHPRTPIAGAKSNSKIVSFQKNMGFDSYGKQQSYNAPTGKRTAFAYTTALNHLLAKDSRQKLFVGDASTVFWAEKQTVLEDVFADLFSEPAKENPDQINQAIHALFDAPRSGAPPLEQDYTRFYVLGLAPNAARIAVRFWQAGTVGETARHIRAHFDDCAIVHGPNQPPYLSLFRLLVATATQGKSENIQPNLAGDIMKAILTGTPYPQTLLAAAVRRCRAEREITYPRAAIIKAVLKRNARLRPHSTDTEVTMSLDLENTNIGYRLGRLFAVLEKIQEEASPGINATIRDRFYGAASGTPVAAFPHLMKLKNHHLSKLENRGRAVNLEKIVGEIVDGINSFPAHLQLQEQGLFAVGYYHQRQDFFKKSDTSIVNP